MVERQSTRQPDGFAGVYAVDLLYERQPTIDRDGLLAALRAGCGSTVDLSAAETPAVWHFAFEDHLARYADRAVPVQALIDVARGVPDDLEAALQQSWDWPGARAAVARCGAGVMVADFLARALPRGERISLIRRIVLAISQAAPPAAIHWRESGRVVDPVAFGGAVVRGSSDHLFPALNVRLFNIAGRPGEMVMDTLGLAALGLPDVQCHFAGLDATRMAGLLYDSAHYLFEHGDAIADGHTIQGFTPEQRWRCRHEDAMVGPARVVLDLDPGPPHAAGARGTS